MTDEQIKHMVDRFLGWKLPEDFKPDMGISYSRPEWVPPLPAEWSPRGTNLLGSQQAYALVRYMIDGMPAR